MSKSLLFIAILLKKKVKNTSNLKTKFKDSSFALAHIQLKKALKGQTGYVR